MAFRFRLPDEYETVLAKAMKIKEIKEQEGADNPEREALRKVWSERYITIDYIDFLRALVVGSMAPCVRDGR